MDNNQLICEKVSQATDILNEFDIDLWLTFVRETSLSPDPTLELILGMDMVWHSAFLLSRDGQHKAIVGYYDAENVRRTGAYSQVIDYHQGIGESLRTVLRDVDPKQLAVNYSTGDVAADGLSHGMYLVLQQMLEGTPYGKRLVSAERLAAALRGRKSPTEVTRIRQAVRTTQALFDEVEQFARPGMTQSQIADFLHRRIDEMRLGYAWDKPYNPIVTCGPDSAIGHAAPGDVVLERGHTLHLDMGVRENDYCADLQRMWYVLEDGEVEAPPEVQRAFDVVYGAIRAGEAVLRPGVEGWKVDEIARKYIVENGYDEYMHGFGHLLGRVAHDGATVLAPCWERYQGVCELPVDAGNVFTLELHVIVPQRGIMSLEEDVLVTDDGVEYLSDPQTELRYIRPR